LTPISADISVPWSPSCQFSYLVTEHMLSLPNKLNFNSFYHLLVQQKLKITDHKTFIVFLSQMH